MAGKGWAIIGLACAGLTTAPADVAALPGPAPTYTVETPDGQYVFVMIGLDGWPWGNDYANPKSAAIRKKYPRRGMYRNDGSAELVWEFDGGYVSRNSLAVLPDGVHVVSWHRAPREDDERAVEFRAQGQVLRAYTVRDLVLSPRSVYQGQLGEPYYRWCERVEVDANRMECTAEMTDGSRFVFDVRTGEVVSEFRPVRATWRVAAALGAIALGVLAWFILRRRAQARRQGSNPQSQQTEPQGGPGP